MSDNIKMIHRRLWNLSYSYLTVLLAWWFLHLVFVKIRGEASGNYIMPSPIMTAGAIWTIFTKFIFAKHIFITFYRTLVGVTLSASLGLGIVLAARYVAPFRHFYLNVFYPGLRAIPTLSIALLAVVWFGLGTNGVVFVIVVTVLPIYLIDLWEGLKVMDGTLVEMALAISTRTKDIFIKLILPMMVPRIFSSSKLGFSVAFKLALVGEVFAATNGMGYELFRNQQEARSEFVYAWTLILIGIVVFFDYYIFDVIERKYLYKWKTES